MLPQKPLNVNIEWSSTHPIVIGGSGILVTSYDLWGHPVWGTDEGVPFANGPVQLGRHTKVHYQGRGGGVWMVALTGAHHCT